MQEYIKCPCCGNQIRVLCEDGVTTVFFDVQNQEELQKKIIEMGIELGLVNGGETING